MDKDQMCASILTRSTAHAWHFRHDSISKKKCSDVTQSKQQGKGGKFNSVGQPIWFIWIVKLLSWMAKLI